MQGVQVPWESSMESAQRHSHGECRGDPDPPWGKSLAPRLQLRGLSCREGLSCARVVHPSARPQL